MNSLKKIFPKVAALLALALLLAVGCADTPKDPNSNIKPDTFISSYNIDITPDSATFYYANVYWRGSDRDGEPVEYIYWVDTGAPDTTFETSASVLLDFTSSTPTYTFYVICRDNMNEWDETPAWVVLSMDDVRHGDEFRPDTEILEGPHNGALTSPGIAVTFGGSDIDGLVFSYQYKLDSDAAWTSIDNDLETGSVSLDITGIPLGPRILSVKAVDNIGEIDASPATVSFIVVDTLRPDLAITSGLIPNAFFFLPSGGSETEAQTGWEGNATWYYSTLVYRFAVDDSSIWSAWQEDNSTLVTGLTLGTHTLYLEAKDLADNSTIVTSDFGVGSLTGDLGVLVVNGIHFSSYGGEAYDFWNNVDPITTYSADFWDLFSGQDYSSTPVLDGALIGTGAIPGDDLGHYSSAIMIVNGFNGDLEVYQSMLPLLSSYLNAGGNLFLACRYGADFVTGDIRSYAHVSFAELGVNISASGLVAEVSGLVDMPGAGLSLTDLPAIPTHADVTMLFSAPDFPGTAGGILVEPAAGGKLVFIAGRSYRFENAPFKTNLEYIVTNFLGE